MKVRVEVKGEYKMAQANMLEFFMEDVAHNSGLRAGSYRAAMFHDDGHSMCPDCGIEIVFEHDHPEFTKCPECGGKLVK
jgi:Zn finger protein HypA/HybF involved in hydrogenase expression